MAPERCPQCGASLPQSADWCPRCFTRLEPEPPQIPPSAASHPDPPIPASLSPAVPPPTPGELLGSTTPRGTGLEDDINPDIWAERLAASEGARPGRAADALMGSRGMRIGVMIAGSLAVILLLGILLLVVSLFVE
ncbi:MAG: zinc ribbon domain-containing protein [Actinobacteria bacterium]|nr:zinc ribbon domain-containing protein [Actinomycetota bacterium]